MYEIKDQIQVNVNNIVYKKTNYILGEEVNTFENNFANYINLKKINTYKTVI